ncbi:MAG TPA: hypothetical protein VKA36_07060 [Solirubrobacterales bacterium]|nr:hypothetical protein [Solirubrobacterales bacterium]
MEAAQSPQGKKLSVGDVINETFSIYGQNAVALIGSALAIFVVVGLVAGILQDEGGAVLLLLAAAVRFAGQALYTGFVVNLVSDARDGRRDQSVGDLISSAMPAILPLIAFGILFGIGVAIGFVLLIIPGLILLTFWCVGAPAIVVEGIGPFAAFKRSWDLVRGDAWSVFATLVVVLLILIVIGAVLGAIGGAIGVGGLVVASIIAGAITAPIWAIAVSVMYFDLGGAPAAPAAPAAPVTG